MCPTGRFSVFMVSPLGGYTVGFGSLGNLVLCYRSVLEANGAEVPPDDDERHLPRARFHAQLAGEPGEVEPLYLRVPDAEKNA